MTVAPTVAPTATPAPTVVAAVAPTPAPTMIAPPPEPASGGILLYALVGVGLVAAAGAVMWKKRQAPAARGRRAAPVVAVSDDEELLVPAFAEDPSAEDVPLAVDEVARVPAELRGAIADSRALPAHASEFTESVLGEGEIQIRIGADVYTCPDVASLRSWVEEGRVIENSEILAPDGTWLMAGSIPDLEQAFAGRRESLGY